MTKIPPVMGNARLTVHPRESRGRYGNCDSPSHAVGFKRPIPLRRRIMEGIFVATSLVLLWLIILAIDGRAGAQMAAAVTRSVAANGGAAAQLSDSAGHVTRSFWELSFVYGPLMTFGAIAIVLVVVMTRTTHR